MSKTIYLDGTETLIFTRMLVEPNYYPDSPISKWELLLLNAFMKAGAFPGQMIVVRYQDLDIPYREWPNPASVVKVGREILDALGLRYPGSHEFEVRDHAFSILIKLRQRGLRPHNDFERITFPPWPTTKSTP